jgi:hypothetical protein
MKSLAVLSITLAFLAQAASPSPRDLLRAPRPLTAEEIAIVLRASRDALTGKTLRLSSSPVRPGMEVLMGRSGRPRRLRVDSSLEGGSVSPGRPGDASSVRVTRWREDRTTVVDYTGRLARQCGGSPEEGEMVIEYTRSNSTGSWTVHARRRDQRDWGERSMTPALAMLQGGETITSGEHRQIGGRRARALVAPWTPPTDDRPDHRPAGRPRLTGDPIPNVAGEPRAETQRPTQWLWIDTASLLPLRWELSGRSFSYADFGFEPIDLRPPAGLDLPECIP